MKVFIDTNVIIDILERREPFFGDSYRVIQLGIEGKIETFMSASAVTDLYYLINRSIRDAGKAREKIGALTSLVNICDANIDVIETALILGAMDFGDAVAAYTAWREDASYIVTRRNEADFAGSPVMAISPTNFLREVLRVE